MGHAARPAASSTRSTTAASAGSAAAAVRRRLPALAAAAGMVAVLGVAPAGAAGHGSAGTGAPAKTAAKGAPAKTPVAVGYGGAVSSVDPDASAAGIDVLRHGGNAVDAAVATAAALGVTEPYSAGVGGGGYFVYYNAKRHKVYTLDGRETAPRSADQKLFLGKDGKPLPFADAVTSGLSVGTPGTPPPGTTH
ncbi:hypothetical protein SVIO_081290 [Streptomyces violaceusniger]|uniref:Gamma-glutamyltransferase n=1 Tax=Streptomyces violaceusniger TaxID=68280 RepID=A0A4D4LE49_STRVO|nr:hypothetical protein SVIO_081290 [Streptomyces violaceusniger]